MTKSELVNRLLKRTKRQSRGELDKIVDVIFEEIIASLEKNTRVELRGFGTFFVKCRKARVGCDPRSGKIIRVDNRYIPFFRPGKVLQDYVNQEHFLEKVS